MGRKLRIIFSVLVLILLVSLASAVTYRQNADVNLRHSVRTNNAVTSTASCNITIFNPNFLVLSDFQPMSYDSTTQTFNYTLVSSNTSEIGIYVYDVTCVDSGLNETEQFDFEITTTGKEYTIAQSITYIFVLILSIFFLVLFIYGSTVIKFENGTNSDGIITHVRFRKHLKLFFIAMTYVTLMWIAYVAYNMTLGYLQLGAVAAFFKFIYMSMLAFSLPLTIVFFLIFSIKFIGDLKLDQKINRGLTVRTGR